MEYQIPHSPYEKNENEYKTGGIMRTLPPHSNTLQGVTKKQPAASPIHFVVCNVWPQL